jgi:hypothetical protein
MMPMNAGMIAVNTGSISAEWMGTLPRLVIIQSFAFWIAARYADEMRLDVHDTQELGLGPGRHHRPPRGLALVRDLHPDRRVGLDLQLDS